MKTLEEHFDDLDRMIDTGASKQLSESDRLSLEAGGGASDRLRECG